MAESNEVETHTFGKTYAVIIDPIENKKTKPKISFLELQIALNSSLISISFWYSLGGIELFILKNLFLLTNYNSISILLGQIYH
jgi:hypothetical protein